ncbi:MAG: di-trans,poly-cis-decaprenylcistransferase [Dehalococcoidales bacterium]|nr:di-trans,poly-cis-decaprenylcistransferase [Dehalococcoidales bacterium]
MKEIHRPNHVAIIMDGNGRWAEKRGLPRLAGHQAGVNRIRSVVKACLSSDVKYLTLYGFSTENWTRPEEEVQGIFSLLEESIDIEGAELNRNGVKMNHLGRLSELPDGVRAAIERNCYLTRNNTRMVLNFAFNYGGRTELLDAACCLINNNVPVASINADTFSNCLYTAGIPDVDLLIRTGGELRISNFLLWQSAYAELYFTRVLWPEFTDRQVMRALTAYDQRQRRFGGL